MNLISEEIEQYCLDQSQQDTGLLKELVNKTLKEEEIPQMLSGPLVGGLLQLLIKITGAKNILEIGMFTGYSTLKMAEALPEDGEIHTCELMEKHVKTAESWFNKSNDGYKITIHHGRAIDQLNSFKIGSFDLIFIDADKINYPEYYRRSTTLLKVGGIAVLDNMLWDGEVLNPKDGNAKALRETAELIKNNHRLESLLLPVRDGILIYRKL
jgi:caffeoyl-CoA O-methyltransferase|tara:strand:- start:1620 stop:2255 length:636 start_codon:yes stop_codon:yes gene_type:complete